MTHCYMYNCLDNDLFICTITCTLASMTAVKSM